MASGALIGSLRVTLGLDTAEFEAGAGKAQRTAAKAEQAISGSFQKAGKAADLLGAAVGGLAAGFAIEGISQAVTASLDFASSLGEQAQQAGVTTKTLQEYRLVATQVGLSQQDMDASLAALTRSIGRADAGAKAQAAAFRALGVSTRDANDHLKTTDEVLPELVAAFGRIEDPARRAQIEMDLFGSTGQRLDTLLAGGTNALNEMLGAIRGMGIVLSDEQIQKADATADKISLLQEALRIKIADTVVDNASSIDTLANSLIGLVDWLGKAIEGYKTFYYWSAQKMNAAGGWDFSGNRLPGEAAAAARSRYFQNAVEQDERDAAAAGKPAKSPMRGPSPHVSAIGGGGGRTQHTRRSAADDGARRAEQAARNRDRAERDIAQALDQQRGLQQQLTTDLRERAALEHERSAGDAAQAMQEIAARERKGELTKAEADQLRALEERNAEIRHTIINWRLDDDLGRQELENRRASIDLQTGMLRTQEQAARTDAMRQALQLKLLDLAFEEERIVQQRIIDSHSADADVKARAQALLDSQGARREAAAAAIRRDTAGPLAKMLDGFPQSAAEVTEALQRIESDGIGSVIDGLADAATGARWFGDVFANVADDIIRQLTRIALQKALLGPLTSLLGGGGLASGFSTVDIGGSLGPAAIDTTLTKLPGFATGGSFTVGGAPGIDKNLVMFRASRGEMVDVRRPGQSPRSDSGGTKVFDFRGALTTQDVLDQVSVLASQRASGVVAVYDRNRRKAASRSFRS